MGRKSRFSRFCGPRWPIRMGNGIPPYSRGAHREGQRPIRAIADSRAIVRGITMRRMLLSLIAAGLLLSNTGCYCFHQFLRCAKQRFCCCHDPVCGPPCAPPPCAPAHCGPHCGPSCAHGGCGPLYLGDITSIPAGKHQPCNACGEWVGKSYPQMPHYATPKHVVSAGAKPMTPQTASQPARLRPTPNAQPHLR